MIKHTDLINTLIACVGGLGLIAGLLRYVDDWREKRKEKPIEFSALEAIWEALSGGVTAIGVFWILEGYTSMSWPQSESLLWLPTLASGSLLITSKNF